MRVRFLSLALILVLATTGAAAFQEQFVPIDNIIGADDQATFNLTVTNTEETAATYRLSLGVEATTNWILSPTSFTVPAGESRTQTVTLRPRSGTTPGSYYTRILLEGQGDRSTLAAAVSYGQGAPQTFVPNVGVTVSNPERVDPREPLQMGFEFDNRNRRNLDNLTVEVSSDLFYRTFQVSLDGLEQEGQTIVFSLNNTAPPGEYKVNTDIFHEESTDPISSYSSQFTVEPYTSVSTRRTAEEGWFRTAYTVELTNDANVERDYLYNVSAAWYERLFLSAQNSTLADTANGTVAQWSLSIPADETVTVSYERNYQGLAAFTALLIAAIASYFYFRSPVVARKEAKIVKHDDGSDELKVQIHLRNRSSSPAYDVSVTDRLPSILEYEDYNDIGYISPSTIREKRKGETTVHWDIDELDPLEERILVYEATPRLEVLGDVDLPGVRVQFENEDGHVRVYESWSASAGSDTEFLENPER